MWWNYSTVMKCHNFDENSSMWWRFKIVMKVLHCDDNYCNETFPEWKTFIFVRNTHHRDVSLSLWWCILTSSSISWLKQMKIHQTDENLSLWWKIFSLIKFIIVIKFLYCCHHCDENWWIWIQINILKEKSSVMKIQNCQESS